MSASGPLVSQSNSVGLDEGYRHANQTAGTSMLIRASHKKLFSGDKAN